MAALYLARDTTLDRQVALKVLPDDVAAAALFRVPATSTIQGGLSFEYVISADGQKFLVNTIVEQTAASISLILNRKPIAQ
jgi:hypothetical protein